jgi:D-alanyl-D-alanine carboxypeptidase
VDEPPRHLVYSVTKTFLAVPCLRLELELAAPARSWLDDPALPDVSLVQLLNHTSGIPDYGRLPEYVEAVRSHPSDPWEDEEVVARALAAPGGFAPGAGWAYSNTGYLLVRRILETVEPQGLAALLEREVLGRLGLADTALALELGDLDGLVAAPSSQVGDG